MNKQAAEKIGIRPFDGAVYLDTAEDVAGYLDAMLEDNDPAVLMHALGVVARSKGMTQLAQDTGLAREALYRALSSSGNPSFATIQKVLIALGLRLHITPAEQPDAEHA
jgi:probable addiction module antidote protein